MFTALDDLDFGDFFLFFRLGVLLVLWLLGAEPGALKPGRLILRFLFLEPRLFLPSVLGPLLSLLYLDRLDTPDTVAGAAW
jgi:hypothetical protein